MDVSKLEEVCVWSELSSSCCFLQNRALASPVLLQGLCFHSAGERAMSNWSPSYTPESPKGMGNLHKRANVSEEQSKWPWARPKRCTSSPLPLPGDWGTHHWCFWYCSQWVINTAHNRKSTEGLVVAGWCWWGRNTEPWAAAMKHPSTPWRHWILRGKKAKLSA